MNKKEIVEFLATEGYAESKAGGERMLNAVVKAFRAGLRRDGAVQVVGFGGFKVKDRAERKGRNPQTGDEITIPASRTVAFRPGKKLKDFITTEEE